MSDAIRTGSIRMTGHNGDEIEGYAARPLEESTRGGVVLIHHLPGFDR